jgi:hypothetical protein
MLNDPDKMVQKGLSLLNKLPAFISFMKQNSELASLFRLPDNYGTPASLAGLQTRSVDPGNVGYLTHLYLIVFSRFYQIIYTLIG